MHEKRSHPRVQTDLAVKCERKDGPAVEGVAKDVSMGGMFIECVESLPFGTQLTIVTRLPDGEVRLAGVVRWAKPGGLGVQFGLLGARETHALANMLKH